MASACHVVGRPLFDAAYGPRRGGTGGHGNVVAVNDPRDFHVCGVGDLGAPRWLAVATCAPAAAAVLWTVGGRPLGRRWLCGVVGGYAAMYLVPIGVFTAIATAINAILDRLTPPKRSHTWHNPGNCPD